MAEGKTPRRGRRGWLLWPTLVAVVAAGLYQLRDELAQLYKGEPGPRLIPALFHPYIDGVKGSYFASRFGPKGFAYKPVSFERDGFGVLPTSFDHRAEIISRRPSQGRLPFNVRLQLDSPARLRRLIFFLHVLTGPADEPPPSLIELWSQTPAFVEEKSLPEDGRPLSLVWGRTLSSEGRPPGHKTRVVLSYLMIDKDGAIYLGGLEDAF